MDILKIGLIFLMALGFGILLHIGFQRVHDWRPSAEDVPIRFNGSIAGKDAGAALMISPDGVLQLNIPLVYKIWQFQVEAEAKAKKQNSKTEKKN